MICLFILYIFPFQKVENLNLNYSLFELIELISIYCVLFICIGSSSLYIYQKFVSLINQIIGKEEKETKDMQKMFSILGIFWISYTSMLAMVLPLRITLMVLRLPISLTPPALYKA